MSTHPNDVLASLMAQREIARTLSLNKYEVGRVMEQRIGHEVLRHAEHAKAIVKAACEHFGLPSYGVEITLRSARSYGVISFTKRLITLYSKNGLRVRTLLHELGHALAPHDRSHGREWKQAFWRVVEWYMEHKESINVPMTRREMLEMFKHT